MIGQWARGFRSRIPNDWRIAAGILLAGGAVFVIRSMKLSEADKALLNKKVVSPSTDPVVEFYRLRTLISALLRFKRQ